MTMPSYLSADCVEQLSSVLDAYPQDGAPGTVVGVVNNDGKILYLKAVGVSNVDTGVPMSKDQVFWIASCTKMVTGLAVMQLVEQVKLDLDAPIGNVIPELANPDVVYESSPTYVHTRKASKPITLKMLLTHTAGFAYSSPHIYNWFVMNKKSLVDFNTEMFKMPLVHEPGDVFEYGISMDWAGIAVERASGMSLGDYCEKYIFDPLHLNNITFDISQRPDMHARLHAMHRKVGDATGTNFVVEDHPTPMTNPMVHAGGSGIFSTAADYLQVISVLLNDGRSSSGVQIVKPETLQLIFENHVANVHDQGILGGATSPVIGSISLLPGILKGWGFSFLLNLSDIPGGRKANSAQWIGIANLFWHADPTSGIGSVVFNCVMPFGDPGYSKMTQDLERVLYMPGHIVKA